jgi:ArsR family transcriptional regulator
MESKELLTELGEFFKIFADPTRIRILELLTETEKCVGEISDILNVSQSAVSHQLKILRLANVVNAEKNGQVVTYRLADEHIRIIIKYGLEHIKEKKNEKN